MVKANEAYRIVKAALQEAGVEDAGLDARLMLQKIAEVSQFDTDILTAAEWQVLQNMAQKRIAHTPLQYLLGSWPFLDLELEVGPGVLVPRPETEEVCLAALSCIQEIESPVVLDLCSGTGALALGIQFRRMDAHVTAVEWDGAAYGYLQKNTQAFRNRHSKAPHIVLADALEYYKMLVPQSLDMIVSNPPYVAEKEYLSLAPELYHEPKQALVAPDEGLLFYKVIADKYRYTLKCGGFIVFEIGSGQGIDLCNILEAGGFQSIRIVKDMSGNDRIAIARVLG